MRDTCIVVTSTVVLEFAGLLFGLYHLNTLWAIILQALGAIIGILLGLVIVLYLQYREWKDRLHFKSFRECLAFLLA